LDDKLTSEKKEIDMQLQFEVCVKEVFWNNDGLQARVEVGYMGAKSMTITNHQLGEGKFLTELINTHNSGTTETLTIKVGEKRKLIE